jgi:hypothetical protein
MFRSILRVSVVLSIGVWALTARPVWAQITTGTLSGSVRDAQGAVVPGATVTLVSAVRGTTTDTQTSTDGDFVFPNVTAGTCLVRVTMDGFKTLERPGVVVSPGDRALLLHRSAHGPGADPLPVLRRENHRWLPPSGGCISDGRSLPAEAGSHGSIDFTSQGHQSCAFP